MKSCPPLPTKPHLTVVRRHLRCQRAFLLVICPDPDEAKKCRRVISTGHPGFDLAPEVIDPLNAPGVVTPVVIGKSLGSLAAPLAADRGLAAVWFTPLLRDEPTVAALRRATGPFLLVGGTADPYWDGLTARSLTADMVEIDGADHAMVVPGRLTESAAALGRVISAVEDFFDHVIWPQPSNRGRTM